VNGIADATVIPKAKRPYCISPKEAGPLKLGNALYIPDATVNLVSVSSFDADRAIPMF
jgi:hypothetical protein